MVGWVPVWISPKIDLFIGVKGTIEAEWSPGIVLTQALEGGFTYDRVRGFDWIGNGHFNADPDWLDIALTADVKLPYLRTDTSFQIYDAAGPMFPLETYLKLSAGFEHWNLDPCDGLFHVSAAWGVSSRFKWYLGGGSILGEFLHFDQLEKGTEFEIKAFEWPLKTWYPQVACFNFPFLQVSGAGILTRVVAGTDTTQTSTVRLTNTGGVELPWHVDYIDDNPTQVIPDHGKLAAGAFVDVLVSVATADLNPGVYSNPMTFTNDYDYDTNQPDSKTGTSQRPVRVEVTRVLSTAPVLTAATYTGPGRVQVTWTFNPAASPVPIDGYRIDTSTDGGVTWTPALMLAGAGLRTSQVGGLPRGLVYLRVAAYSGNTSTPVSDVSSVNVLQPAPVPVGTGRLNDTGITTCSNATQNGLTCPVTGFPGQDAEYGRDQTHNDDSDGHAGFSFTKLDADGNPLPASAAAWSCVRDNVTGLIWEVKTDDSGLRDKDWTYSWYNPDAATNGGSPGTPDGGNNCFNTARCDTQSYVADVNAQGLCGAHDWRLPDPRELLSIVSNDRVNPSIDTTYFPNTVASWFWSASPYASPPYYAWHVDFYYGYVYYGFKSVAEYVRLVRGGQ